MIVWFVDGPVCNGEAQDSKSVDMESLPEEKGIQEKARYKNNMRILCGTDEYTSYMYNLSTLLFTHWSS